MIATITSGTCTVGPTNAVTLRCHRERVRAVLVATGRCSEMVQKKTKEGRRGLILLQKKVNFPANFSGNKKTRKPRSKSWCKRYKKR